MRTPLLLTLMLTGVALACLATPAQAQMAGSQYNITISITPPSESLTNDQQLLTMDGRVEFIGDPTMALNLYGVPVTYKVTQAPAWLVVTVSPANDVIQLTGQGTHVMGSAQFTISAQANGAQPATVVDLIEITATATPNAPLTTPKSVAQSVPIQFYVAPGEEECDEDHGAEYVTSSGSASGAASQAVAPAEEGDSDLHVQSGGVTPIGTWYAVGGFGLVGAGVGLMLRRRLR